MRDECPEESRARSVPRGEPTMSTWGPQPGRGPREPEPTSRRAPRLNPGPGDCLGPRCPCNPSTRHFGAVPCLGLQSEDDQHEAEAQRRATGGRAGPSARSTTAGPSRGPGPRGHGPASAGHHGPHREGSALLPRGMAAELMTRAGANHAGRKLRTWESPRPGQVCHLLRNRGQNVRRAVRCLPPSAATVAFLLRESPRQGSRRLPNPYGPHCSCPDPDPPILLGTYFGTGCTTIFPVKQPAACAFPTPNVSPHRSHSEGRPAMARTCVFSVGGSCKKGDLLSRWPRSNTPVTASPATETLRTKSPDGPWTHAALRPPHGPLSPCWGLLLAAGHLLWASPFAPACGGAFLPFRTPPGPRRSLTAGSPWGPRGPLTSQDHSNAGVATTGPQSPDLSSPMSITGLCKRT